uniref:Uncharacterized protein n=1 Tax=Pseudomonas phage RVTF4 TaxID=3236931 RepID=A0AB39CCC0_9VIRU
MSFESLFHDMVIESQSDSYTHRSGLSDPISSAYDNGLRHGILHGITLGFRTMAESGHISEKIYEDWHEFVYSDAMSDPQEFRKRIMKKRSEGE